jgi:hypothetical protein
MQLEKFTTSKGKEVMTYNKKLNPTIECKDGFAMSVQAHEGAYCIPRQDYPSTPYTHVECGFPSSKPFAILCEYAELCGTDDYTKTVYAYVPVEVVQAELDAHGGIIEGEMPS